MGLPHRGMIIALLAFAILAWGGEARAGPIAHRSASLLRGVELDASLRPSELAPLRLTDGLRFDRLGVPTLDAGGALDEGSRQALAMTLGFLVGFGTGHLVARDTDGFALFIIVDTALVVCSIVLDALLHGPFAVIGIAALVASHVVQGIDAYREAGGPAMSPEAGRLPALRIPGWSF